MDLRIVLKNSTNNSTFTVHFAFDAVCVGGCTSSRYPPAQSPDRIADHLPSGEELLKSQALLIFLEIMQEIRCKENVCNDTKLGNGICGVNIYLDSAILSISP